MATAVASVWGGTILQMGEHMLCHEYFPDDNLSMRGELKRAMIRYYDFAVAYENLLRPDAPTAGINSDWFGMDITSSHDSCVFNQWGPQIGQIATVGRHVGTRDVIHLLSYRNATHLDWCDSEGDQASQTMLQQIPISFAMPTQPARIWVASPDNQHGTAQEVDFEYLGGQVTMTIPALQYWTMIVIEK
jgi:dextranase